MLSVEDALFLDFDGTLVELAPTPEAIVVPERLGPLLEAWRDRLGGALALVSGRSLDSLRRHIPLALAMAGSHGAEWRDSDGRTGAIADVCPAFERLKSRLISYAQTQGLLYEDKGRALALHFRQAPEKREALEREIEREAGPVAQSIKLIRGNGVRELHPVGVDKGAALARFMQAEHEPFRGRRPVYIGDDTTDEDAFAWVNAHGGVSIKVGAGPTRATERLADPRTVLDFLHRELTRLDAHNG